jgi:3-hydroxyacyl-CoA dehydrogenase / enoyl-CoA hydratase / 3-hydroxybutyryl-CoA epimerase
MDNLRLTRDDGNLITVWFDSPGKNVNSISPAVLNDLREALVSIESGDPAAVIFASAKPRSFIAGADLFAIKDLDRGALESFLREGQMLFDRIAHLPMPTIAAINGDCLGGGLELALACACRVSADTPAIKIGLPETKLGILPGWGGTIRLPRTIGLTAALPLLLAGKTVTPKKALKAHLVDEIVRPEALMDAARRLALARPAKPKLRLLDRAAARMSFVRNRILRAARTRTKAETHGHYPAPLRLLDVVAEGLAHGASAGFDAERQALLDLIETDESRNLLRLFFLGQEAKRVAAAQVKAKPADVKYAAVIGGGTMGAGIVHALINAQIQVRLVEVSPAAVSVALNRIHGLLDDDVRAGRKDALAARNSMNRVVPTSDWAGLGLCDFVVEAVIENLDAKRSVIARIEPLTRSDVPIASNTSSFSIASFDEAVSDPSRLVGMHFFNPVPKMPLVEVARSARSDPAAVATTIGLAARLGKTPVLVNDIAGFFVNRVLVPYLAEAVLMAAGGVSVERIDKVMKIWGWPMGPFELLDEIGLDVGAEVLKSLLGSDEQYAAILGLMQLAIDRKWLGKKTGIGFYDHRGKGSLNAGMAEVFGRGPDAPPTPAGDTQIQWRLMVPMINEAARLLAGGTIDSADSIDLATVMSLGFPPFRGGLARYADSIGAQYIERLSAEMAATLGSRFRPTSLWHHLDQQHTCLPRLNPSEAHA